MRNALLWIGGFVVVIVVLFCVAGNEDMGHLKQTIVGKGMELSGERREVEVIATVTAQRVVDKKFEERDREEAQRAAENEKKRILAENTRLKNKVADLQKTIADLKKPARPSEPDPNQVEDQGTVTADIILQGTMTLRSR